MKKAALIILILAAFNYLYSANLKDMTKLRNSVGKFRTTHGFTNTPEYSSYWHMKDRCLNKNHVHYASYGGRGITVCDRWLNSFQNFIADMGSMPVGKDTLDRIESNGNYEPNNCRWATRLEQGDNRKTSRRITIGSETKCLSAWCRHFGIKKQRVYYLERKKGMPIEFIFTSHLT